MACVTMTTLKHDAIIIGTGETGSPLARRLSEAVSELIPTMLEELGSAAA